MTDEQKRQIAEETVRVLQKSLKDRNMRGLKSFLKDLAHRQTQAAKQTLSGVIGSHPISNANRENLKHGYYVLSEEEKGVLKGNSGNLEFIWDKLKPYNINNNHTAREAAGVDPMKRDNVLEADRVFVVTEGAVAQYMRTEKITYFTKTTPLISAAAIRLSIILLYTNFISGNILKDGITISSTFRTPEKQYDDMKPYMDEGYNPDSLMVDTIYRDEINAAYKQIRDNIAKTKNPTAGQEKN